MLNVHPNDLLARAGKIASVRRVVRGRMALRPAPPSWRVCRLTMPRAQFRGFVAAWIAGLAILLAVALTVRWS